MKMSDMKAPDSSWKSLVRPAGPNPSCGALFYPLLRPVGTLFVPQDPDSFREALFRPSTPASVPASALAHGFCSSPGPGTRPRLHLSTAPVLLKLSSAQASPSQPSPALP